MSGSDGSGSSQRYDRAFLKRWALAHAPEYPQARLVLEVLDENETLRSGRGRVCSTDAAEGVETFQLQILADDGCPHVSDVGEAA